MKLPGYTFKDLGPNGGTYDDTSKPKVGWHTMETMNIGAAESAFDRYPPHLGVVPPWPGYEGKTRKVQYVPLNLHAYAFSGSENDDEYIIQVEVAGFAKDMRNAPDSVLKWLAEHVVLPLEDALKIPRVVTPKGFHDSAVGGVPLATTRSKIRMTEAEIRAFSGHLGHQHMTGIFKDGSKGDEHWDPGALNVPRIFYWCEQLRPTNPNPIPVQEDDDMITGFDKSPEDVARAEIRALCQQFWGNDKMTTADQDWLLGTWAKSGREAMVTAVVDHPKVRP